MEMEREAGAVSREVDGKSKFLELLTANERLHVKNFNIKVGT